MSKIVDKLIRKIHSEHIKPTSKIPFLVKNVFFWLAFLASIIAGSILTGMILLQVLNADWDLMFMIRRKLFLLHFFIPYIWGISLMVLIGLSYLLYHRTKWGYRKSTLYITGSSLVISIICGSALYIIGISDNVDSFISRFPDIHDRLDRRELLWDMREEGLIGGRIVKLDRDNITIANRFNQTLVIITPETEIFVPKLEEGIRIKVLGESRGDDGFEAIQIKHWNGGNLFREFSRSGKFMK